MKMNMNIITKKTGGGTAGRESHIPPVRALYRGSAVPRGRSAARQESLIRTPPKHPCPWGNPPRTYLARARTHHHHSHPTLKCTTATAGAGYHHHVPVLQYILWFVCSVPRRRVCVWLRTLYARSTERLSPVSRPPSARMYSCTPNPLIGEPHPRPLKVLCTPK